MLLNIQPEQKRVLSAVSLKVTCDIWFKLRIWWKSSCPKHGDITLNLYILAQSKDISLHKFSITDFFSKCDQICRNLQIWSHLLKKPVMENFIFLCSVFLSLLLGDVLQISMGSNMTNDLFLLRTFWLSFMLSLLSNFRPKRTLKWFHIIKGRLQTVLYSYEASHSWVSIK